MTRSQQLQDALDRCAVRLKIAERNLAQCDQTNLRLHRKLHQDYRRATDDLAWLRQRRDEALDAGSAAFRRAE